MKILKILGILVCIAILLIVFLVVLPVAQSMRPAPSGTVTKGVYAVNQKMVDFYIIKNGKDCIAIDAGIKPDTIGNDLNKLGLSAEDVKAVFLTHSDRDHVGGLPALKNATIFLPADEEQMINGTTKRKLFGSERYNSLPRKHSLFRDGEIFRLGAITVKGISTPGHTPGSMSYVVNGKILFTGDLAVIQRGRLHVTADAFNNDTPLSEQSLKKLASLAEGLEVVCTAHSGCTKDVKKAFSDIPKK